MMWVRRRTRKMTERVMRMRRTTKSRAEQGRGQLKMTMTRRMWELRNRRLTLRSRVAAAPPQDTGGTCGYPVQSTVRPLPPTHPPQIF